jgi:hypothetical protein
MKQWYFRFKSGDFENGYFEVNSNRELAEESAKEEFVRDCTAQGFTPMFAELVLCEQTDI